MRADIQFPPVCDICRYYYDPVDCLAGIFAAPGIGHVCRDCRRHVNAARNAIAETPRIACHMIADGDRNNLRAAHAPRVSQAATRRRPKGNQP
jgi:hypothetical protein